MIIGIPKEIKKEEYRVGAIPSIVVELVKNGHEVLVEHNAGHGIGFTDDDYRQAGAKIFHDVRDIFAMADMIIKVKEPQRSEYELLREGQILFTYLHLAADLPQAEALMASGCVAIGYETVTGDKEALPLLSPMSQIAGRLSIQAGAHHLEKPQGGNGLLLGGIPGVYPGKVVVIGGGVVGTNAITMALGKEAEVIVLDKSERRLQELDKQFSGRLKTVVSSASEVVEQYIAQADLVVGAVLIPGQTAPKIIQRSMLSKMQPGSVIVDVAIDQGGCIETSRATTHADPTYVIDGVIHYCVANMPGAVPKTATLALNQATKPFILELANKGYKKALLEDAHLRNGLNVYRGHITYEGLARDLNKPYVPAKELLNKE